jgi:ribosomal protein L37E
MPANVVKTREDEERWKEAKKQAAKQGQSRNYAYIMGIYQRMLGKAFGLAMRPHLLLKAEQLGLFGGGKPSSKPSGKSPKGGTPKKKSTPGATRSSGGSGSAKPPGSGWQPIPGGTRGGFRRRKGRGYEYWYPSGQKVTVVRRTREGEQVVQPGAKTEPVRVKCRRCGRDDAKRIEGGKLVCPQCGIIREKPPEPKHGPDNPTSPQEVDKDTRYMLYSRHPSTGEWMVERSFYGSYFRPGSEGADLYFNPNYLVMKEGIAPPKPSKTERTPKKGDRVWVGHGELWEIAGPHPTEPGKWKLRGVTKMKRVIYLSEGEFTYERPPKPKAEKPPAPMAAVNKQPKLTVKPKPMTYGQTDWTKTKSESGRWDIWTSPSGKVQIQDTKKSGPGRYNVVSLVDGQWVESYGASNFKDAVRVAKKDEEILTRPSEKEQRAREYEARIEAKRERYEQRAATAAARSEAAYGQSRRETEHIPMGQPILVGHHSEKRHRAALKRSDRAMRRSIEEQGKAAYYAGKAEGYGKHGISSDDPMAVEKLQTKLKGMENRRAAMKEANKRAKAEGKPKAHESYEFSNLSGNMRRVRERIKELQAREAVGEAAPIKGEGYEVTQSVEDNRIRIHFPGKPDAETRKKLKRQYGLRWSPSAGAWQRHLNEAGKWAVKAAIKDLFGDDIEFKELPKPEYLPGAGPSEPRKPVAQTGAVTPARPEKPKLTVKPKPKFEIAPTKSLREGGYSGHAWQGGKREETKNLSSAQTLKLMRDDIKKAKAAGVIPNVKVNVRKEEYAGGWSVTMTVKDLPEGFAIYDPNVVGTEGDVVRYGKVQAHTPEAKRLLETLESIANQYNYDDSDSQTDYFNRGFYTHIGFDNETEEIHREMAKNPEMGQALGAVAAALKPKASIEQIGDAFVGAKGSGLLKERAHLRHELIAAIKPHLETIARKHGGKRTDEVVIQGIGRWGQRAAAHRHTYHFGDSQMANRFAEQLQKYDMGRMTRVTSDGLGVIVDNLPFTDAEIKARRKASREAKKRRGY